MWIKVKFPRIGERIVCRRLVKILIYEIWDVNYGLIEKWRDKQKERWRWKIVNGCFETSKSTRLTWDRNFSLKKVGFQSLW